MVGGQEQQDPATGNPHELLRFSDQELEMHLRAFSIDELSALQQRVEQEVKCVREEYWNVVRRRRGWALAMIARVFGTSQDPPRLKDSPFRQEYTALRRLEQAVEQERKYKEGIVMWERWH
jgi:hypothetical protein